MLATSTALETLDLELLRGRGPFKVASQGSCMSGRESDSDRVLRCQVAELRDELRRLQLRVDRQEDQLSELSREVEDSRNLSSSALEGAPSSVASVASGSYSVVTPVPAPPTSGIPPSWSYREAVAREIGEFLRRSLSGHNRGNSGREKLNPLQSRIYLVLRDYQGTITERPVRVFTRFSAVKSLCFHSGSPGDSIFIGLPSQREAQIAVEAAGCTWPSSVQQWLILV